MPLKKNGRRRWIGFITALFLIFWLFAFPELTHKNAGVSISGGSVGNGSLKNGYLMPYSGANYRYFSPTSYFILNNAYVHQSVFKTVKDAYKICETNCPKIDFLIMECSNVDGGKMKMHYTHQNGTSIDFAVVKKRNGKQFKWFDKLGVWHYALNFKDDGMHRRWSSVEIDFETMGKHILALDDAGKKHGVRVKKVIFKIEMKEAFYKTKSGAEVRKRGIYFAKALPANVNNAHKEHYHVDFEVSLPGR